jgi:Icc-related predicted phosphoesterase
MKLLIYSDLHLEFDGFQPKKEWLDQADLVIQVGDLHHAPNNIRILKSWGVPVLFVPGNHDFWSPVEAVYEPYAPKRYISRYEHHLELAIQQMREEAYGSMVHVLYNDTVTIGDIEFIGSTLWYDATKLTPHQASRINDYHRMYQTPTALVTPAFIAHEHHKAVSFITDTLDKPFAGKRVLLTHHPAWIPPIVWGEDYGALKPAYGTDLSTLWRSKVNLMVHGHVHDTIDANVHGTHIVCNPRGYPDDDTRRTFRKQFLVRV